MHERGEGVKRDFVEAYAWFSLAASQGRLSGQKELTILTRRMSQEQLKRGRKLAEVYGERYVAPYRPSWQLK